MQERLLGTFEERVLLAIRTLGNDAYSTTIAEHIGSQEGPVNTTLNRLDYQKGYLECKQERRAGESRTRNYYRLNRAGETALKRAENERQKIKRG